MTFQQPKNFGQMWSRIKNLGVFKYMLNLFHKAFKPVITYFKL